MKCHGIGRLTADPEVRTSQDGGTVICSFTLACNRRFKKEGQPDADFISCRAFGKTAEFIEKYFLKGMKMYVEEGTWQTGSYEKDGHKVYTNTLIVEQIDFCEGKTTESKPKADADGFMNVPDGLADEELPFV